MTIAVWVILGLVAFVLAGAAVMSLQLAIIRLVANWDDRRECRRAVAKEE